MIQPSVWEKKRFCFFVKAQKCPYHMTFDPKPEHTLEADQPGYHRVQVSSQSSHLAARMWEVVFVKSQVPVSRDLWPWIHPGSRSTWGPSYASSVAIQPFVWEKKQFAQRFTDGWMDGRHTMAYLIPKWNELKMATSHNRKFSRERSATKTCFLFRSSASSTTEYLTWSACFQQ